MSLIEKLNFPEDLKTLTNKELETVAKEIREKIIDVTSKSGGHLSSSLGAVELSVALHSVFDSPKDKIIWDVGHQAYSHKILTGRLKEFEFLRKLNGLSGFPNRQESLHDTFTVGHASTSISQALGVARARDVSGKDFSVIAVIGDGALSGGLALEGINNVLHLKSNLIVILNDNEMSISNPVGAISNYLTQVRTSAFYSGTKERVEALIAKIPKIGEPMVKSAEDLKNRVKHFFVDFKFGVIFEELGVKYLGPIDGHNIPLLISTLNYAKDVKGPVLIHIITKKGKGYIPAEGEPTRFHGISPFFKENGDQKTKKPETFTSIFGKTISEFAESNKKIVAITAAMADGTGLKEFSKRFPDRFYDVGIAEEHAVSFASGFASQGFKPFVAIYSTFLQRAYDQVLHDVCLNNLPVVFAIDRAGIVGEDGATHNGVFDIAFLRAMPNIVFMAPANGNEFRQMLKLAENHSGPVAIRYPKNNADIDPVAIEEYKEEKLQIGKCKIAYEPKIANPKKRALIISIGSMVDPSVDAAKILEKDNISVKVINSRFIKPLDKEQISEASKNVDMIFTVEEGVLQAGFGSAIKELLDDFCFSTPIISIGIPDEFVQHGSREQVLGKYGLNSDKLTKLIRERI